MIADECLSCEGEYPLQIKTSALVLTKYGVGSIICPKCNTLNLVRDGIFQYYCGFTTNIISCACGCGQPLLDRNIWGRMREYVSGHNGRLDKSSGWRVGRIKCGNYYLVYRPKHHEADKKGYVPEHRIIYEDYYKCSLLSWSEIHHIDHNGYNNDISNLKPFVDHSKHMKMHRKNFGQVCGRCYSVDVPRSSFSPTGKQKFKCGNCRLSWTVNKRHNTDYGQICLNCNSKHNVREGGVVDNRLRFKCIVCKKWWSVPLSELVVKRSDNDLRYERSLR